MQKHWIWLSQRSGLGHVGCKKLLAHHSAEELYEMTSVQYETVRLKGMRANWYEPLLDKDLTEAERIMGECEKHKISIITYNDPIYPKRLKEIYDPPCVLYCKGTLPDVDGEATVGVVGTRRCTNYGLILTKQMASLIALSGGIVVSGGARGIDTMALYGAMNSYMPVICVLAGGLDQYYPRENRKLFEDITRQGCLLSEFPPGAPSLQRNFVARNRLISGLSLAVLITEAPKNSGAMITAELALSQNRDVFTMERADSGPHSRGNEELIQSGCEAVRDGWELLSRYAGLYPGRLRDGRGREAMQLQWQKQFGRTHVLRSPQEPQITEILQAETILQPELPASEASVMPKSTVTSEENRKTSAAPSEKKVHDLPESEQKVLEIFGADPMELDEIIMRSGMDATAVATALTMLQIKKRIIKCFGNSYQRL